MKKNGKRHRAMLKIKEQNRLKEIERKEKYPPFSKSAKRRRICLHYDVIAGGFMPGYGVTLLEKYSENQCRCVVCEKVFSLEALEKSIVLGDYLAEHGCMYDEEDEKYISEMSELFPPVYYFRVSENEIVYDDEYMSQKSLLDIVLKIC